MRLGGLDGGIRFGSEGEFAPFVAGGGSVSIVNRHFLLLRRLAMFDYAIGLVHYIH